MKTQFNDVFSLTVGTFLAPIGWELMDPVDMYQYSHAFVFTYGLPAFHTGIMAGISKGPVDAVLYITNGIDTYVDPDENKAAGTRIGVSPVSGTTVGFSYLYHLDDVMIADIDATVEVAGITLGAEFNYGAQVGTGGSGQWVGALLTGIFSVAENVGLTVRADWFQDEADRLGVGYDAAYINGTVSPSYQITENALVLFEYTYGYAKPYGAPESSGSHTLALESTFAF